MEISMIPSWLWILTVIPALGLLIFVHELGHFLVALRMGIKVEEFGFGIPPRMMTLFHWRGVPVTLNWLPIGGFVRMTGEEGHFEAKGSLAAAPPWKKIPVMAAGAFMNLVTAVLLFAIVGMIGQPERIGPVSVQEVVQDSPAAQANLRQDDIILAVEGQPVNSRRELKALIGPRLGQPTQLDIQRNDPQNGSTTFYVTVMPTPCGDIAANEGCIGVVPEVTAEDAVAIQYVDRQNPIRALVYGIQQTIVIFISMFDALGVLVASLFGFATIEGGIVGPVGIAQATGEIARTGGFIGYLQWTALISVNLALINLLPLPALDGGRIVFALIEWARGGKRVPPEKEALVHALGMMALLGLMLLITFSDIRNILLGRNPLDIGN
jgi:regulator of sigma E protease